MQSFWNFMIILYRNRKTKLAVFLIKYLFMKFKKVHDYI